MKGLVRIIIFLIVVINRDHISPLHPSSLSASESAPEFELIDIDGKAHRLSDYRGNIVILNFWATWCKECVAEMPSLDALYKKFKNGNFIVLGVSIDRKNDTVLKLLKKIPVSYPILLDKKGEVFVKRYTVIGLPTTFIIDGDGLIAERIIGGRDFNSGKFVKKIDNLLNVR